jgi:CDP-glucose 4,6-dehydratase
MESVAMTREFFWLDRPVLITGGSGLLGTWLVKRLLAEKADVLCLVRDWIPQSELFNSDIFQKIKIVWGDVRDQKLLERILGEYEINTVIHLAAQTIVGIANRNPLSTFETNIQGTWNILEAIRRSPTVEQIIVASSDKAYGSHNELPYTETTSLTGRYPYDVSKSCADLLSQSYAATYDMRIGITRCGNFYGGGDLNWNRIIPGTIRSVIRGTNPVIRSDGKSIRDYFYVEDGAAAYMLLAEQLAYRTELAGEAFNFSNELQIPVIDLVYKILSLMDSDLKPNIRDERLNEIPHQYLSAKKARRMLKWNPLFTLDQGLNRTIEWYQDYFQRSSYSL